MIHHCPSLSILSNLLLPLPHLSSHLSSVICHLSSVIPHLSSVICHLSSVICHLSSVICHLSSVISHLSSLISHLSSLISHLSSLISHLSSLISQSLITHLSISQSLNLSSLTSTLLCPLICMLFLDAHHDNNNNNNNNLINLPATLLLIRPRIFWIAVFYTTARLPEQLDCHPL
jgi:hypothetical protein